MDDQLKQQIGRALFYTKLSRVQLVDEVAKLNNVSRQAVYSWMRSKDVVRRSQVYETLGHIIEQSKGE